MSEHKGQDRQGAGATRGPTMFARGGSPPRGRGATPAVLPDPYRYTMTDLEEQTGFSARTIRYYVAQGLLPPAHGRGPSATYDLGHLLRLRAIQLLRANYLPLEDIKSRLATLSNDDIAAMFEVETTPPEDRWRRIQLHPDVELHVRERAGKNRDPRFDRAIEMIAKQAKLVIEDMGSDR